jgi:hypothetical protein
LLFSPSSESSPPRPDSWESRKFSMPLKTCMISLSRHISTAQKLLLSMIPLPLLLAITIGRPRWTGLTWVFKTITTHRCTLAVMVLIMPQSVLRQNTIVHAHHTVSLTVLPLASMLCQLLTLLFSRTVPLLKTLPTKQSLTSLLLLTPPSPRM